MNRIISSLILVIASFGTSVVPALAQTADSAAVPLRGPGTVEQVPQTVPTPQSIPAPPPVDAAQLRGPAASTQTTTQGNPIDYGRSGTNSGTPITDSLSKTGAAQSGAAAHNLSANFSSVTATAKLLETAPLMRCRDENLKFVEITLRNDSTEVALVHGDIAEAKVGDRLRTAASARYIGTVAKPKLNTKGRVYTGLVLAGSWGLAGPIFYELVTPDQHANRYLGTAVGVDGSRHEIEEQRFGLRVLMPGEETVGWLAFECPSENALTSLLIPVNYSKSTLPSGSLFVPVKTASAVIPEASPVKSTNTQAATQSTPAPASLGVPAVQPPLR